MQLLCDSKDARLLISTPAYIFFCLYSLFSSFKFVCERGLGLTPVLQPHAAAGLTPSIVCSELNYNNLEREADQVRGLPRP